MSGSESDTAGRQQQPTVEAGIAPPPEAKAHQTGEAVKRARRRAADHDRRAADSRTVQAAAHVANRVRNGDAPDIRHLKTAGTTAEAVPVEVPPTVPLAEVPRRTLTSEIKPPTTVEAGQASAEQQKTAGQQVLAIVGAGSKQRALLGRPCEYTEEEATAICAWIQGGRSLNAYCRQHGRSVATVYTWMRERPDFQSRYAVAHEDRADTLVDEMLQIADEASGTDIAEVQAARLRVDVRRWIAQKMRPQRYGDIQQTKTAGSVVINLGLPAREPVTVEHSPHTAAPHNGSGH